mmetsp:Transcript_8235/g.27073  ORF Transcript_8235/g.27073 Transcript_8235/m.27073 type:complete len:200 (+) Transcript_8235:1748-2347(+)
MLRTAAGLRPRLRPSDDARAPSASSHVGFGNSGLCLARRPRRRRAQRIVLEEEQGGCHRGLFQTVQQRQRRRSRRHVHAHGASRPRDLGRRIHGPLHLPLRRRPAPLQPGHLVGPSRHALLPRQHAAAAGPDVAVQLPDGVCEGAFSFCDFADRGHALPRRGEEGCFLVEGAQDGRDRLGGRVSPSLGPLSRSAPRRAD